MKTFVWLAVIAALVAAVWWWMRRGQVAAVPWAPLAPVPFAPGSDSLTLLPTQSGNSPSLGARAVAAGDRLIAANGAASEAAFRSLCKGSICDTLAPGANLAGKATAAVTVKSIEYSAKGAKVAAKGVVAGVKKLKFW